MSYETLFTALYVVIVPFWLLLIIAPRWPVTMVLVQSVVPTVLLGGLYGWFFFTGAFFGSDLPEGAGFSTLANLKIMFTDDKAVLAGWVHYLVFDLFVGAWETRDAQRRGVNHFVLVPCLLATFVAGPLGLVLYFVVRAAFGKGGWRLQET